LKARNIPNPIVTAEIPRGMDADTFKKVENILLPRTITMEASIPIRTAMSAASRAKYSEFHKEEIGVMGITFVRFVNPVKKAKKFELPWFRDRSKRMKIGKPNKQKR